MSRSRRSLSIPLLLVCVSTAGDLCGQSPDRFAAIAPRMQEFVDKGEIAGAVTLIANRDTILHLAATGRTDLAKNRKMRTDDIFWIASMSKPIAAICIAMLADDGKLNFDDPLAKHLPEFAGVMVSRTGRPSSQPARSRYATS
ncbi:MAG TPA: serine hydrolase domain-containing protein [Bryobacteraceae bacterium]|nr:serine hydrolase domain-containing protein [Bryobacteraceae bacterium]